MESRRICDGGFKAYGLTAVRTIFCAALLDFLETAIPAIWTNDNMFQAKKYARRAIFDGEYNIWLRAFTAIVVGID